MVLPYCNRYVEGEKYANSVIVMDNATIHKTPLVIELLASYDVKVVFLPPYSPDFNPIEMDFSVIKSAIRRYRDRASDFPDFSLFLMWICQEFGGKHAYRQARHCGWGSEEEDTV